MTTPGKVLTIARSQLGVSESPPHSNNVLYSRWYGLRGAWCAMFVSWCLQQSGMPRNSLTHFAWTPSGYTQHRKVGRWYFSDPKVGDLVFFSFSKPSNSRPYGISHVGFVEAIESNGSLICIEGNTNGAGSRVGGSVMRHRRATRLVAGYGRPYTTTEEDDVVTSDDIEKIARRTVDILHTEGLTARTKEDIAKRVWSREVHGKIAANRLHDADVRTEEIKKAVVEHAEETQAPKQPKDELPEDEENA